MANRASRPARPPPPFGWLARARQRPGQCTICASRASQSSGSAESPRAEGRSEGSCCVWVKVGAGGRGCSATSIVWRGRVRWSQWPLDSLLPLGCESKVTVREGLRERGTGDPGQVVRARPLSRSVPPTLGRSSAAPPRPASAALPARSCWNADARRRSCSFASASVSRPLPRDQLPSEGCGGQWNGADDVIFYGTSASSRPADVMSRNASLPGCTCCKPANLR